MGLNIKNERVHALAREAARVTGKSQTSVIEEALERLLRDYGADPLQAGVDRKLASIRVIVDGYSADPGTGDAAIARVEDLYDETSGLPR